VRQVMQAAHALSGQLTLALRETAAALAEGDLGRARRALEVARSSDPYLADLGDAIDVARETISVRPPVWRARERLPLYAEALGELDHAVRNTRVLARRAVAALRRAGAPPPPEIATAVSLLADAVEELVRHLDDPEAETSSRRLALEAARRATAVLEQRHDLQTTALVAQVRSTAIDLLRGSGLSEDEATAALDRALGQAGQPAPSGADSR
jgi:cell division septum initiation protein DivIVA